MRTKIAGLLATLATVAAGCCLARWSNNRSVVHADGASKWTRVDAPLKIDRDEKFGYVSTEGFWELTGAGANSQRLVPVALKIECTEYNNTCGVVQASVSKKGVLEPAFFNYYVATWTKDSIVASDFEEGPCGLGHHLWLDLKDNKVTDKDYLKGDRAGQDCPPATLHSYVLRGGTIVLRPVAGWQ